MRRKIRGWQTLAAAESGGTGRDIAGTMLAGNAPGNPASVAASSGWQSLGTEEGLRRVEGVFPSDLRDVPRERVDALAQAQRDVGKQNLQEESDYCTAQESLPVMIKSTGATIFVSALDPALEEAERAVDVAVATLCQREVRTPDEWRARAFALGRFAQREIPTLRMSHDEIMVMFPDFFRA